MAKVVNKIKENPKLMQKKMSDGRESLYLESYLGYNKVLDGNGELKIKHHRKKEFLGLYLFSNPRTPLERQQNKDNLALGLEIRAEKEKALRYEEMGKPNPIKQKINLWDYFQKYLDSYDKKDVRMIEGSLNRFKSFIAEYYPKFTDIIKPDQIDRFMIQKYVDYLMTHSTGEGAKSYYARFKKIIKSAVDKDVMRKNPCDGVTCIAGETVITKDMLSVEEYRLLANTPYQNKEIVRAFFTSLFAGYRFCDVKDLKYSDVDYENRIIRIEQNKTKGKSKNSQVVTPLSQTLISFIGYPKRPHDPEELVFDLPSHTGCLKALRTWTRRAGIKKHITWHCARHSFGVALLTGEGKVDIKTLSSLLGHSGLKYTERYTRTADVLKKQAIESLPEINLV